MTQPLRSDTLVADILRLAGLVTGPAAVEHLELLRKVRELCTYHLEIRDKALEIELCLHDAIKRIEDGIN